MRIICLSVILLTILLFTCRSFAECYSYINESGKRVYVGSVMKLPKDIDRQGKYQSCNNEIIINGTVNKDIFFSIHPDLTAKSINTLNEWAKAGLLTNDIEIQVMNNDTIEKMSLLYENAGITEKVLNDRITQTPDSNFSSPEKTFQSYRNYLRKGELDLALNCLTPYQANKQKMIFSNLGKDKMKKIGIDMQQPIKIRQNEDSAEFIVKQNENGKELSYYIQFLNVAGNWKIDEL